MYCESVTVLNVLVDSHKYLRMVTLLQPQAHVKLWVSISGCPNPWHKLGPWIKRKSWRDTPSSWGILARSNNWSGKMTLKCISIIPYVPMGSEANLQTTWKLSPCSNGGETTLFEQYLCISVEVCKVVRLFEKRSLVRISLIIEMLNSPPKCEQYGCLLGVFLFIICQQKPCSLMRKMVKAIFITREISIIRNADDKREPKISCLIIAINIRRRLVGVRASLAMLAIF